MNNNSIPIYQDAVTSTDQSQGNLNDGFLEMLGINNNSSNLNLENEFVKEEQRSDNNLKYGGKRPTIFQDAEEYREKDEKELILKTHNNLDAIESSMQNLARNISMNNPNKELAVNLKSQLQSADKGKTNHHF